MSVLSSHLILCHPLLLLPSIFPSIRVFSNELTFCIRWPKYWSFSFSISLSNEYSGLISFRIDWLDLLTVQGTLKSLLHHHSSKASIPRCSVFYMVQLSHPHMTTEKTLALTLRIFVGKVMSIDDQNWVFCSLPALVRPFLWGRSSLCKNQICLPPSHPQKFLVLNAEENQVQMKPRIQGRPLL